MRGTYNLAASWMPWEKIRDLRVSMMRWDQTKKLSKGAENLHRKRCRRESPGISLPLEDGVFMFNRKHIIPNSFQHWHDS